MVGLKPHPEFGGSAQVPGQAERCVDCDPATATNDIVQSCRIHVECPGKLVHAHSEWDEKVFFDDLAGMNG